MTRKSKQHAHLEGGKHRILGELQAGQLYLRYLEGYDDNPHMKE